MMRRSVHAAMGNRRSDERPLNETRGRAHDRSRLATWRRRHLNSRAVVALVALSSLLAPGVMVLIDAAL